MPQLKKMIGQQIALRSPVLSDKPGVMAKLVDVDEGGIWVEYPPFIEDMLQAAKASQSAKTPVIFVPFAKLLWIIGSEDYPYLSEKLIE